MKKATLFLILIPLVLVFCGTDPEKGQTPFFNNVDLITINTPAANGVTVDPISFTAPSNCTYIVVGIFSADPSATSTNTFVDPTLLVAGIRTGMTGFSTTVPIPKTSLKTYDLVNGDFTNSGYIYTTGTRYLIIWGYDSDMILKASSPKRSVAP